MLETLRQAGLFAWILVPFGLVGAVAAVGALISAGYRAKDARRLGAVVMLFGVACAGIGAGGTMSGRRATDKAIVRAGDDVGPVQRQRMRGLGYESARASATTGLALAALPLLAGAVAMMMRPRRTEEEAIIEAMVEPWPTAHGRALALASGVLSSGVAIVALAARVPNRGVVLDATAWDVLDALHFIQAGEGRSQVLWGCRKLESALPEGANPPRTVDAAAVRAADRVCVEERIQEAAVEFEVRSIRARLEALGRSSFVKRDPDLAKPIEAAMDEVRAIESSPPPIDPESPSDRARYGLKAPGI